MLDPIRPSPSKTRHNDIKITENIVIDILRYLHPYKHIYNALYFVIINRIFSFFNRAASHFVI